MVLNSATISNKLPARIQEPFRTALIEASAFWIADLGDNVRSIVLFGSMARGQAKPSSDIDLLVIADVFPKSFRERRKFLLEAWDRARKTKKLPAVEWNLVTKSTEEAGVHSPLYLDMVEDAILLLDRGAFFEKVLLDIKEKMRKLGSRRIFLEDGSWYWDLKPGYRFGDVIEI